MKDRQGDQQQVNLAIPVLEVTTTAQGHHFHDRLQDEHGSEEVVEDLQGVL